MAMRAREYTQQGESCSRQDPPLPDSCPAPLLRPPAKPGARTAPARFPPAAARPHELHYVPCFIVTAGASSIHQRPVQTPHTVAVAFPAGPRDALNPPAAHRAPRFRSRTWPAAHGEQSGAGGPIRAQNNKAWCWSTWAPARRERLICMARAWLATLLSRDQGCRSNCEGRGLAVCVRVITIDVKKVEENTSVTGTELVDVCKR